MHMIREARKLGVRSIVHCSFGRWLDTPIVLLVCVKLVRRIFWALRHTPGRVRQLVGRGSRAALQATLFWAAGVWPMRKVEKVIARFPWARKLLRTLAAAADQSAPPSADIFRQIIAGTQEGADFVRGRVVLVCGSLQPGGTERQVVNTLLELARCDLESVRLLCDRLAPNHPAKYDFYLPHLRRAGVEAREIRDTRASWSNSANTISEAFARHLVALPRNLVPGINNLYWEFQQLKPEVVHAWLDRTNVRAGIAAAMAGVPRIVLSCRNINPSHFQLYQSYMDPAYEALADLPNVVLINNSRAGAIDYARWLKLPESRFRVVYNGVHFNNRRRASEQEIAGFRAQLGIPPEAPVVGSAFRFNPEKRPLLWIESAAVIARTYSNARFLLFGDGHMRNEMLARAKHLGIADSLLLPGITNEVDLALSSMDVLLLTSYGEGTPNIALEAQWLGIPAVATEAGGMREGVEPGVTGWIVEEPDPRAIAQRVVALLEDASLLARAHNRGPAFVKERFGLQRMVRETVMAYGMDPTSVGYPPGVTRIDAARRFPQSGGDNSILKLPHDLKATDVPARISESKGLHSATLGALRYAIAGYLAHLPETDVYAQILELEEFSMLHWEVLAILRFLAKNRRGAILEIGPFIGASTIAMAQASDADKHPIITVEKDCAYYDHPQIPTKDIISDLRRNLRRYNVQDKITIIKGNCADANTIEEIKRAFGASKIGLFMIDADGHVDRYFKNFARYCHSFAYLVIDDYLSEDAERKTALIAPYIDRMVAEGKMRQIGIYGWGTWVGQLVDNRL